MGLFQRQNPDVHVVYDVALTGADAVTASDALRTLANELLAGKGPDLLVLDGMPIDSYVEKGVLLDLSEPVGGRTASGEWLKAEAESFKTADGRIYAVPARFSVPVILADEEAARAKDLTALGRLAGRAGGAVPRDPRRRAQYCPSRRDDRPFLPGLLPRLVPGGRLDGRGGVPRLPDRPQADCRQRHRRTGGGEQGRL